MRNWTAIRARYLRDELPTRLAGLAANLGRISSFASQHGRAKVIESLMEESKYFIEWTAAAAEIDTAAVLAELQVLLAGWQHSWVQSRDDSGLRDKVAKEARIWSERVLEMSGVLT